jgi:hypothetical protein
MQLPIWVWKCTPLVRKIVQNSGRPHRVAVRGIGRFIRAGGIHLPTPTILATALTCAFVPLATAITPPALPAFGPVEAAPISFAPEGQSKGAGDMRAAAVPTQVVQLASPSSGLAGVGYTPTLDARSSTNIGLLAIDDSGPGPLLVATNPIPGLATPIPEMANPVPGFLPPVSTEIDEPGSSMLFGLSILLIAASRSGCRSKA